MCTRQEEFAENSFHHVSEDRERLPAQPQSDKKFQALRIIQILNQDQPGPRARLVGLIVFKSCTKLDKRLHMWMYIKNLLEVVLNTKQPSSS